jgi:hypothetical protein
MTREETKAILAVLKAGYPNFYKDMTKEDAKNTVDLWATMFADDSARLVTEAVKSLICTLKFPPTIADVKEKIHLLTQPQGMSELEAWNTVRRAISYYDAQENYNSLPPMLQRLVGSPNQLREWAVMDRETVNSVIQSNFMRSYKVIAAREREQVMLPESAKKMRKMLAEVGKTMLDKPKEV